MPYPFAPAPTLKELKDRFQKEFNCEFKVEKNITLESGEQFIIAYFERQVSGEVLRVVIDLSDFGDDEDIVSLSIVKSLCRRLKIDAHFFGYTLN